jgi:endonuclease VIII
MGPLRPPTGRACWGCVVCFASRPPAGREPDHAKVCVPEGDSIRRIAHQLAPIIGKRLERVTTQGLSRAIEGATVSSLDPHGKHLVIELDTGSQVRIHLGINGRFRRYNRQTGEAMLGRMSPGRASLALVVDDAVYLWVGARTVEITDRRAPRYGQAVASLGPDILADDFDPAVAAERARAYPSSTIAAVLLDQRVVAGIGNIYKCESLFAGGVDPRRFVSAVTGEQLIAIYRAARAQMQASVALGTGVRSSLGPREPVRGDRYAVYSRTGQPCKTCGTTIESYQLGDPPRWTWSCPRCQPR